LGSQNGVKTKVTKMVRCQCEGITRRGVRCSRTVSNGTRCFQHLIVEQPNQTPVAVVEQKPDVSVLPITESSGVVIPTDPVAHAKKVKYIKNSLDWPKMSEILSSPHYKFAQTPNCYAQLIGSTDEFKAIDDRGSSSLSRAQQSKLIFFSCELYRLNKHLYNFNDTMKLNFDTLCVKLSEVKVLKDYLDQFRLDVQEGYKRLVARRKYIEFVFTHSDLGPLIAQKIAEFYYY